MSNELKGLDAIAVDLEAEENGAWFEFAGMSFLVARARTEAWNEEEKKARQAIYGSELVDEEDRDSEKEAEVVKHCLVEHAVRSWKDVSLKGEDVPYCKEKSREILGDEKYRALPVAIYSFCMNGVNYLESQIQSDEKK